MVYEKECLQMAKKRSKSGKQGPGKTGKLSGEFYEAELERLQGELVKLQYWVKAKGFKIIVAGIRFSSVQGYGWTQHVMI